MNAPSMKLQLVRMHKEYGATPNRKCGECVHLTRYHRFGKFYHKCDLYGDSGTESTDWAKSWAACGMCSRPYPAGHVLVLDRYQHTKAEMAVEVVEGQVGMDGIAAALGAGREEAL